MTVVIERCASPEQLPPLEPLSEVNSLVHDSSLAPPPFLGTSSTAVEPSAPKQQPDHEAGRLMSYLTAPLRLSLILENKGNVARDHLASERTYLAYVRTSLATSSAGVALVQLLTLTPKKSRVDLTQFAKPLGAAIILCGLFILVLGVIRYFSTQSALVRGRFPVARHSVTVVAFVLGSLVGIVFAVLVAGAR